jgi:hypothetical protein
MFKDYIIHDNILDNPQVLLDLSKKIKYYKNNFPKNVETDIPLNTNLSDRTFGSWCGFRSNILHEINHKIFCNTFDDIFKKIFNKIVFREINYVVDSYLHFLPENCLCTEKSYHRDFSNEYNVLFAGVIYLNLNPKNNSGTLLLLNDEKEELVVENKFNRLVLYNSYIPHRPHNGFGKNLNDSRLTLTFFVKKLMISA